MIAQSLGRWGNFFNQEAYGAAVDNLDYLPAFIRDQMYIEGSYRQPTFLYESLWNLLGFTLILIVRRKWKSLRRGHITAFYLIWYGFGRMVIEGMRTDSLMFFGLECLNGFQLFSLDWVFFIHSISKSKRRPLTIFQRRKLNVRSRIYSCCPSFDCLFSLSIITVQKLGRVIDETEKTIKTLTSDVDVTLHHTNELLAKVNVLADDINVKVATIDPLFSAVADLSLSVSDLNDHARVLSKKASSAGSKTLKTGASCQPYVSQVNFSKNKKGEFLWVNYPQSF